MTLPCLRTCVLWFCLCVSAATWANDAPSQNAQTTNSTSTVIKLNVSGWSPSIKKHQIDLVNELLNIAEPKFGPSTLQTVNIDMSTKRAVIALESGELPLGFATGWNAGKNNPETSKLYYHPYLNNLLGLRKLVVRREDLNTFANIRHFEELKNYKAGQGTGWPDSDIYRINGIEVVNAKRYENLFPMLALKRFDFVPMSTLEMKEVMAPLNQTKNNLVVVPNLYIFYPIPIYLRSSKRDKDSYDRIDYALSRYFSPQYSDTKNQHFIDTFGEPEQYIPAESDTVFFLDNPIIDKETNDAIMVEFKRHLQRPLYHDIPEGPSP